MALFQEPHPIYSRPKHDNDQVNITTGTMNEGEHRWMIEKRKAMALLGQTQNGEGIPSPKFELCRLWWKLEAYPNGNTKENIGSFCLFLKLIQMPKAWKSITVLRHFKCTQTHSGFVAVDTFKIGDSFGWPDFTLSRDDLCRRKEWLEYLKFRVNIKILQIRLKKNDGALFYENVLDPYKALRKQTIRWNVEQNELHEMKQSYFRKGILWRNSR